MTVIIITGTSTGVGKTVATAALAVAAEATGRRVCVVKPVQTGVATGEPTDLATVARLSGCGDVHELTRLGDPLAPDTAARLRGLTIAPVDELAAAIAALAADRDVTLVEGSGGVAVRLDTDGRTLLSLTGHLVETCHDVRLVVVTSLALGTLNHTELTVAAILSAGLAPAALVVGSLPAELGLAERCNIEELPRVTGVSLRGCVPAGVGGWEPDRFRQGALGWLDSPALLDG
ncbi:MAG: ATP-dependent dethiobiotin synthetase BioD [Propionibacteriales bacterium]|jgi:dethiobiotin synthase|nr:ATP-dependent dethiobiotin synthetase BioD [Propionibacteriales bacterium]